LIFSIEVSNSDGNIAFGIQKCCSTKDDEDENSSIAWEKLKRKIDLVSAVTLVKAE
jgi:hypothetical protein